MNIFSAIQKARKRLYKLYAPDQLSDNRYFSQYHIGRYTIGCPDVFEWGDDGGGVSIGSFCSIGRNVSLLLGGEHRLDWLSTYSFPDFFEGLEDLAESHRLSRGEISIGHDVWIGYGATVLSGVTIGNGAVIGAKSVVARDIPPYAIAMGNRARVVGFRFEQEEIQRLEELAWWDWPVDKIRENAALIMSNNLEALEKRRGGFD